MGLLELIGVLAIIVILATLAYRLLPGLPGQSDQVQVIQLPNRAHVAEALMNIEAIKAAALEHCARSRSLASSNGLPLTVPNSYDGFDRILLAEGLLERPFGARVGSTAFIRVLNVSRLSASTPVDGANGAYDLGGAGRNEIAGAAYVVEAVLSGVTEADAKELNDRLDGPALGADAPDGSDLRGRVIYGPAQPGLLREVHIYIARQ